ncbi:MAG: hypothetical protein CL581_10320 [Alteromonadaceae bacterium]|nr:hypothetical protein [Alteromonadaceae bacterium]MBH85362.1 hypothetical protein [Alteromonadaceae bacterium]|tara:strand:+ start:14812 stop:15927 length:1116 start_codon:yes stop_codon:yes gene_type:complete
MKHSFRYLALGAGLIVGLSVLLWAVASGSDPDLSDGRHTTTETTAGTAASPPATPAPAQKTDPDESEPNPYADAALNSQILQVADMYEANMAYPPFSQPIRSAEQLRQFQPNHTPSHTGLPFELEDGDSVKLSIDLDRYVYFSNEVIPVAVSVISDKGLSASAMEVRLVGDQGQELMSHVTSDYQKQWLTAFDTHTASTGDWPIELQVQVRVTVNGESLFMSAPLRYQQSVAELVAVNYSDVNGEYLTIPLEFDVERDGYYFLSGNLYSAETGNALVHLEAEGRLAGPHDAMDFRAHIAALQLSGDEGPYELRDVAIVRTSEQGENYDLYGRAAKPGFHVEGFDFGLYQQVPYEDPLQQERLEFLKTLGRL